MNINEVKKQLQNLGISTSTPGLQGDERFEELSFRLEQALQKKESSPDPGTQELKSDEFVVPSLSQLSIGEIRARLTALGETTSTPGISGEERRNVLMRRLINAVCAEGDGHEITSKPSLDLSPPKVEPVRAPSPPKVDKTPVPVSAEPPVISPLPMTDHTVSASTISTLKKELKRLANQRALTVAARLSGGSQDGFLKAEEGRLGRIEAEIARFKALQQKGTTKVPAEEVDSEFLVLNPSVQNCTVESLLSRLEGYRASSKEKVRNHRLRIREEEDDHPQHGVAAEERLKILLSEANLASAANVTGTNTSAKASRTRQKFQEVQALEQQLEMQGKLGPTGGHLPGGVRPVDGEGKGGNIAGQPVSSSPVTSKGATKQPGSPAEANTANPPRGQAKEAPAGVTSPDKWSTDICPTLAPSANIQKMPKEPSTATTVKASAGATGLTSTFLGKAIDLDGVSPKGGTKKAYHRPPPSEPVPSGAAVRGAAPSSGRGVAAHEETADTGITRSPKARPEPPTVTAASGSHLAGVGRQPPPPAASVPSGRQDVPQPKHHQEPRTFDTYVDLGAGGTDGGRGADYSRDRDSEEEEEEEDPNFQDAEEAEFPSGRHGSAQVRPLRNIPLPGSAPSSAAKGPPPTKSEPPAGSHRPGSHRSDDGGGVPRSDSAAEEEEAVTAFDANEFRTASRGYEDEYGQVYGMRRRASTIEEDEDLEELSPTRTQANSRLNSAEGYRPFSNAGQRDTGTATGTDIGTATGTGTNTRERSGSTSPVLATEAAAAATVTATATSTATRRMSSIFEGDEAAENRRRWGVSGDARGNAAKVERRLDYVTVDGPGTGDDDAEGDGDAEGYNADLQAGLEGDEAEADEKMQIKVLRSHAKVLEGLKDIPAAEDAHMRALELDPTNITTLEGFAIFLHQKKGELARAEAFFNRGLQICLPGLSLRGSASNTPKSDKKAQSGISFGTDATMQGNKVSHIVRFVMSYAHFMSKSKGDIEAASILYRKGLELAPENAHLLATFAHFLAQLGDKESSLTADEYFQRALKHSPGNGQYCMWYGKLLKRLGRTSQAELMYKVALERCKGNDSLEPAAICNYATFVFKQRQDPAKARAMFKAGLQAFPGHKGLRKNYAALVKACPQFSEDLPLTHPGGAGGGGALKDNGRGAARAERLARQAETALREEGVSPRDSEKHSDQEDSGDGAEGVSSS